MQKRSFLLNPRKLRSPQENIIINIQSSSHAYRSAYLRALVNHFRLPSSVLCIPHHKFLRFRKCLGICVCSSGPSWPQSVFSGWVMHSELLGKSANPKIGSRYVAQQHFPTFILSYQITSLSLSKTCINFPAIPPAAVFRQFHDWSAGPLAMSE